jgi:hypothetical protein
VYCRWPALVGVQELLPGALREVPDHALGNSILKVRIYPTEGKSLIALFACLFESIVRKSAIVAVIMFNRHAVFGSELFRC